MSARERTSLALLFVGVILALIGAFRLSTSAGVLTLGSLCVFAAFLAGDM